jgi:hypothetical protein
VDSAALRDGVSMSSVGWPSSLSLWTISLLSIVAVNEGDRPSPAIADVPHSISITRRGCVITRRDFEHQSAIGIVILGIMVSLSPFVLVLEAVDHLITL